MGFGEFRVCVLGPDDKPGRVYDFRADTPGAVPQGHVQIDGVWHRVVDSAHAPDPADDALATTVYCRRVDEVPPYLGRRKRRLSLVVDVSAVQPTLRVESRPHLTARWLLVPVVLVVLAAIAMAARLPVEALPAPPRVESVAPVIPALIRVEVPPPKQRRRRTPKPADLLDPWSPS
jgi:hypothetical protein